MYKVQSGLLLFFISVVITIACIKAQKESGFYNKERSGATISK
jgi:hypothetical protein